MADSDRMADRFYDAMATAGIDALRQLYTADAQVIRFDGLADGLDEVAEFWDETRRRHAPYELHSIDQYTAADDVIMWDAMVTTDNGILQTTEVLVIKDGLVTRHIPGIRGYWGAIP
jgi:hypothetical protein